MSVSRSLDLCLGRSSFPVFLANPMARYLLMRMCSQSWQDVMSPLEGELKHKSWTPVP